MLKTIRRGTVDNPWFFRVIIGAVALTFIISMGWWGFDDNNNNKNNVIANVNGLSISLDDYRRAYKNASTFYREVLQEKYDDKKFRKQVIEEMIERQLWAQEAAQMRLFVTDTELSESVIHLPAFQRDGKFSPERYRRILASEKLTPYLFEQQHRLELLINKAKDLIKETVSLTPEEIAEAIRGNPDDSDKAVFTALFQKQQKVLYAYTLALKKRATFTIQEELL